MANYGILYQASYDTITGVTCIVQILKKEYVGLIYPLELSGVPVVHNYQTDEAQPSIKGSSLTLVYINTGSTPITNFYSTNDDEFKIKHFINSQQTFEGFIVQDNCSEDMVDYRHEVTLQANDNLGLLKDVFFDENIPDFGGYLTAIKLVKASLITGECYIYMYNTDFVPAIGVAFTISGHINPEANNTFTPIAITKNGTNGWVVQVANFSFDNSIAWQCIIAGTNSLNLYNQLTLLNFIKVCLYNTGLELNTNIYCNIFEDDNDNSRSFLEQVLLFPSVFYDGKNYKSCWDILDIILSNFKLTLLQANAQWNIVRWSELRYGNNTIPGLVYDNSFNFLGITSLSGNIFAGFEEDIYPETAPLRTIDRPYKFAKETFNYKQPVSLINNYDLQQLGAFDHTETIGDYRYDYYQFPAESFWQHFFEGSPFVDRSLIVVKTNVIQDNEVDRYILQPKTNLGGVSIDHRCSVQFNDIPVSEGDEMNFSFRIKAASSTGGDAVIWRAGIILCSDEGSFYSLQNGLGYFTWNRIFSPPNDNAPALSWTVLAAQAQEYITFETSQLATPAKIPPFPIEGVLRIRIYGSNDTNASQPSVDAIWKDLKLTITANINESSNIVGQVHLNEQVPVIKNNGDIELIIDDSPRTPIAGTMLLVGATDLVLNRTKEWYRITNNTERLRIGEIITFEELFTRRKPRTKIEGNFYNVIANGVPVSILSVMKYYPFTTFNFIFGSLAIDYRNNKLDCTMYEIYEDGEIDSDLANTYTFTYLYSPK